MFPLLEALRQEIPRHFVAPRICRSTGPMLFRVSSSGPSLDREKFNKLIQYMQVDMSHVDVGFYDDMPRNIRGAFWVEDNGTYRIVLNSQTADDTTIIHEMQHLWSEQAGLYRPWRLGYEASAQRFAERHEYEYRGILVR